MPQTAFKAGTGSNVDRGSNILFGPWSNPTNVASSNDVRATVSIDADAGPADSDYLKDLFDWTAEVPADATIQRVDVNVERSATVSGSCRDTVMQLRTSAGLVGTNKAATSTNWPLTDAVAAYAFLVPTDVTLTASDVRDPATFGIQIAAKDNNFDATGLDARIDCIEMAITYQESSLVSLPRVVRNPLLRM